ncbi:TPA: alanyl-tRNA editing protein [Candidatus Woesearchaeota archaeon]|nr:alanyl-tRNA editing protein [Candidatus Woesearchaeota archaeon]
MTELLFLSDSYAKQFEAKVVKVDGRSVVLDKTLFYPQGGGQPSDTGVLVCQGKEYTVVHVSKKDGEVVHEVDKEGMQAGETVTGMLDWAKRHRYMRGHTACHLLSYVVNKETGALITGNQIAEDKCRVDFDLDNFDREQIKAFEEKTNELIRSGAQVTTKLMPRDEAFKIPSVLKLKNVLPPSVDEIRIVDVEGLDVQACGGTHVKDLSEIGRIEVTKAENKGKSNRRVYFVLKD